MMRQFRVRTWRKTIWCARGDDFELWSPAGQYNLVHGPSRRLLQPSPLVTGWCLWCLWCLKVRMQGYARTSRSGDGQSNIHIKTDMDHLTRWAQKAIFLVKVATFGLDIGLLSSSKPDWSYNPIFGTSLSHPSVDVHWWNNPLPG